jgi:hypothetical protein
VLLYSTLLCTDTIEPVSPTKAKRRTLRSWPHVRLPRSKYWAGPSGFPFPPQPAFSVFFHQLIRKHGLLATAGVHRRLDLTVILAQGRLQVVLDVAAASVAILMGTVRRPRAARAAQVRGPSGKSSPEAPSGSRVTRGQRRSGPRWRQRCGPPGVGSRAMPLENSRRLPPRQQAQPSRTARTTATSRGASSAAWRREPGRPVRRGALAPLPRRGHDLGTTQGPPGPWQVLYRRSMCPSS